MGFLERILRNTAAEETTAPSEPGSFERLSDEELQTHMGIDRYDSFDLTEAIRPSYDLQVIPRQGFRHDEYRDEASGVVVPVLMAAATRHVLMDLFLELIEPLGGVVDVVLETSHHASSGHDDLYRESIDVPVLKSILIEYEDLLLNDGCTGIAVVNPQKQQEVQLDEHKMLIVYGRPLERFEKRMIARDVYPDPQLRFLTEAEHVHSSSERFFREFEKLKTRLGMDADW
jgi:hypothetical protein